MGGVQRPRWRCHGPTAPRDLSNGEHPNRLPIPGRSYMKELKTVLPYVRPYRREIALGLLMVLITNAFTISGPYLMKLAIDGLGDPSITGTRIGTYAGLIVIAAILGGAAKFGMRILPVYSSLRSCQPEMPPRARMDSPARKSLRSSRRSMASR